MIRPLIITAASLALISACDSGDDSADDGANTQSESQEVANDEVATSIAALSANPQYGELRFIRLASEAIIEGNEVIDDDTLGMSEIELDITCFDREGTEQACDDRAARAHILAYWHGEVDLPRYDADLEYEGAWTLERTVEGAVLDGEGRFTVNSLFASASGKNQKSFDMVAITDYMGVVLVDDDLGRADIVDGTIHYDIDTTRTHSTPGMSREDTVNWAGTLSFDGEDAVLQVDEHEWTVDKETGLAAQR